MNKRNKRNIESKLLSVGVPHITPGLLNAKSEKIYHIVKEFIEKTKKIITFVMTLVQDPKTFDSSYNYIEA